MSTFDLVAILIVLAADLSYLNLRVFKLPPSIGLMALSLVFSLAPVGIGVAVPPAGEKAREVVSRFEFHETLMRGMLGFLLFSGAHPRPADPPAARPIEGGRERRFVRSSRFAEA